MVFQLEVLGKNGPLSVVWLAAHNRKIKRSEIQNVKIAEICDEIENPELALSLRLKGILLVGVVNIQLKQQEYFIEDMKKILKRIHKLRMEPNDNLLRECVTRRDKITLPKQLPSSIPSLHVGSDGQVQTTGGGHFYQLMLRSNDIDAVFPTNGELFQDLGIEDQHSNPLSTLEIIAQGLSDSRNNGIDNRNIEDGNLNSSGNGNDVTTNQGVTEGLVDPISTTAGGEINNDDNNEFQINQEDAEYNQLLGMDDSEIPEDIQRQLEEIKKQLAERRNSQSDDRRQSQLGAQQNKGNNKAVSQKRRGKNRRPRKRRAIVDDPYKLVILARTHREWTMDAYELVRPVQRFQRRQERSLEDLLDFERPLFTKGNVHKNLLHLYNFEQNQNEQDDIERRLQIDELVGGGDYPGVSSLDGPSEPMQTMPLDNETISDDGRQEWREEFEVVDVLREALERSLDKELDESGKQQNREHTPESLRQLRVSLGMLELGKLSSRSRSTQNGSGSVQNVGLNGTQNMEDFQLPVISSDDGNGAVEAVQEIQSGGNDESFKLQETSGDTLTQRNLQLVGNEMNNPTTLTVLRVIQKVMEKQVDHGKEACLSFFALVNGLDSSTASKLFFKVLICSQNNFIRLMQPEVHGDILVYPGPLL